MKTYDVAVTRDGKWWMVEVPELDGLTQARRLEEVEQMAREYIAVTLDVPLSGVDVDVTHVEVAGQDLALVRSMAAALRDQLRVFEEATSAYSHLVARQLVAAKVPVRDISSVLGVSHQRISQIVSEAFETTKERQQEALEVAKVLFERHTSADHQTDLIVHLGDGRRIALEVKSTHHPTRAEPVVPIARKAPSKKPDIKKVPAKTAVSSKKVERASRSAKTGRYVAGKTAAKHGKSGSTAVRPAANRG